MLIYVLSLHYKIVYYTIGRPAAPGAPLRPPAAGRHARRRRRAAPPLAGDMHCRTAG